MVLDTNLFVAAFWNNRSASAEILRACEEGRVRLFYSQQISRELFRILGNIKANGSYVAWAEHLLAKGTEIQANGKLRVVVDDPDDDKFLECASAAGTDYLITNDHHLLQFNHYESTRILTPTEFRKTILNGESHHHAD